VGRLNRQVKEHREATSPRVIPGAIHPSAENIGSQKEHPGGKKKAMEALTNLYEPTFLRQGPTGHVNLLLDVKVLNS
jgi:hypothetical protein